MTSSPKAKITDENRRESDLLKKIWEQTGHSGLTQAEFGYRFDIGTQAAVGFFLNGKSAISLKAAKGFARGLACRIADFSARLAELETAWPFELVDRDRYDALSPAMQHKAQVRMDDAIKALLLEQESKPSNTDLANTIPGVAGEVLVKKLTVESTDFHPGRTKV
jgi:hypothetical protein